MAPYTFAWHGLPLDCVAANGSALSCTSAFPGTYTVVAVATDASGSSASSPSITLTVYAYPSVSLTVIPYSVAVGEATSFSAYVQGGSGNYVYAWSGLPPGCFGYSVANLTCVPSTSGTYFVSVTVSDSNGASTTGSIQVYVSPATPITPTPPGPPLAEAYPLLLGMGLIIVLLAVLVIVLVTRRPRGPPPPGYPGPPPGFQGPPPGPFGPP
jgi:hypothetical protein